MLRHHHALRQKNEIGAKLTPAKMSLLIWTVSIFLFSYVSCVWVLVGELFDVQTYVRVRLCVCVCSLEGKSFAIFADGKTWKIHHFHV